jgi:hypothetical protein
MSLPLPRRFAQAALLLGAAAAPLVGAGAAHALSVPPTGLGGGVTNPDLGGTVDGTARHGLELAGQAGSGPVQSALPTVGRLVGTTAAVTRGAVPTHQAAGDTLSDALDTAGRVTGESAESAGSLLPDDQTLPTTSLLPNAGALPGGGVQALQGNTLDGLPGADLGTVPDALHSGGLPLHAIPMHGIPLV